MSLEDHINIIFKNITLDKKIDFYKFWSETYKKIYKNQNPPFNNSLMASRINKNFYLSKYFIHVSSLAGDFLECGVFKGFSSYLLRSIEKNLDSTKTNNYFLVDSFEGLSEILEVDVPKDPSIPRNEKGNFNVKIEDVKLLFSDFSNVNILKGWIPEVFISLDEKNKYKFVHIDVDLYQPTLDTLEYIYDKVVKGGIIITDDYNSPLFPGNKKAWDNFFENKNDNHLKLPTGQAVLIKE